MEELFLSQGSAVLALHGPNAAAPFRGARLIPGNALTGYTRIGLDLSGSEAEITAGLDALQRWLLAARAWQEERRGSAVYLCLRADPEGEVWRTRVKGGSLSPRGGPGGLSDRPRGLLSARLNLMRSPGWEGAEQELPLSNASGSRVTGGLTVWNHRDGGSGHVNDVWVQGTDVAGSLPAPVRLELVNLSASALENTTLSAGMNIYAQPNAFDPVLEGEDAWTGAPTADTRCSGGFHLPIQWEGSAACEAATWTLSTARLGACRGGTFRVLARLQNPVTESGVWLRWRLYSQTVLLWESPEQYITPNRQMVDLGVLPLPPHLTNSDLPAGLALTAVVRQNASGAHGFSLDFLHLTPLDGWRKWVTTGRGMAAGIRLVDDGLENALYTDLWEDLLLRMGNYTADGAPLTLPPGQDARLYFLWENAPGGMEIDRRMAVRLFYRPRRMEV